jgi:hypothetical protein
MSYNQNDQGVSVIGGIGIASFAIVAFLGIICLGMWGCPRYRVYNSEKSGEAELAQAQYSRQVAVAEAHAKMEAAALLADADTLRAVGISRSNQIIGSSLKGNESYLLWLFIDQLKETKDQVIYIPSGNMGMPILEAGRLGKPITTTTQP